MLVSTQLLLDILESRTNDFKGKSHLSATFVSNMTRKKENMLFVFLSFQHRDSTGLVAVLHTLIFQLLYKCQHLRPALLKAYEFDTRALQSFVDFNQQFLMDLLQCVGATYVVLDGLDEIPEAERQALLKGFIHMTNQCPDLKVMVSSREETDICNILYLKAISLRIGLKNAEDIELYFIDRAERWLDTLDIDDAAYSDIKSRLNSVPKKAEGNRLINKALLID